jgi:hypothetical protein
MTIGDIRAVGSRANLRYEITLPIVYPIYDVHHKLLIAGDGNTGFAANCFGNVCPRKWTFFQQTFIRVYLIFIFTVAFVPMIFARSTLSGSLILTGINWVTLVYVPEVVKLVAEPVSFVEVTVLISWT